MRNPGPCDSPGAGCASRTPFAWAVQLESPWPGAGFALVSFCLSLLFMPSGLCRSLLKVLAGQVQPTALGLGRGLQPAPRCWEEPGAAEPEKLRSWDLGSTLEAGARLHPPAAFPPVPAICPCRCHAALTALGPAAAEPGARGAPSSPGASAHGVLSLSGKAGLAPSPAARAPAALLHLHHRQLHRDGAAAAPGRRTTQNLLLCSLQPQVWQLNPELPKGSGCGSWDELSAPRRGFRLGSPIPVVGHQGG